MFKIGDCDLAPSSTSPGSSSAFVASCRGVVSQYPCTGELEILKALAWQDNPLYALLCRVVLSEVEHAACKNSLISSVCTTMQGRPFWSGTRSLQEFTNQLGIQNGLRVTLQYGYNWNSSWTNTVGIPTGVWVMMWNREHKSICNSRVPSNSKNFWMCTVLKHSSLSLPTLCPENPCSPIEFWLGYCLSAKHSR